MLVVATGLLIFLPAIVALVCRSSYAFIRASPLCGIATFCAAYLHPAIGAVIWLGTLGYVLRCILWPGSIRIR